MAKKDIKSYEPGQELYYYEDGMELKVKVLENLSDSKFERYKLKIIEVLDMGIHFRRPLPVGYEFDVESKKEKYPFLMWELSQTRRETVPLLGRFVPKEFVHKLRKAMEKNSKDKTKIVKKRKNTYIRKKDGLYRVNNYGRQEIMAKFRKQAEDLTDVEIDKL